MDRVNSSKRASAPISAGPMPAASIVVRAPARADEGAAEHQRAELGAVAGAVVGGEDAAAQRLGRALVDQRAQQRVLDPVRDTADGAPDHREGQSADAAPAPAIPMPCATTATSAQAASTAPRHAMGESGRAGRHAQRPRRDEDAVAEAPGPEHAGDEERLGGLVIVNSASAATAPPSVITSSCSPTSKREAVAGAHAARPALRVRAPPRAQHERRDRDDGERRRVDRRAPPQQPGGAERAAGQRPGGEPERAAASIMPLARATSAPAAAAGTSANSAGWLDRDAEPEQRDEHEQHAKRVDARRDAATIAACATDTPTSSPRFSKRSTIAPATPAPSDDRPPEREEQRRDRERRPGALLHVEDQREDGEEVAERGEAGGAGEQARSRLRRGTWRRSSRGDRSRSARRA